MNNWNVRSRINYIGDVDFDGPLCWLMVISWIRRGKYDDADASQSSVQCSVSDHKLHSRVQEVATISDSDTEVEVIVTLPSDTALVVTFDNVGGWVSFVQPHWCRCQPISDSNL